MPAERDDQPFDTKLESEGTRSIQRPQQRLVITPLADDLAPTLEGAAPPPPHAKCCDYVDGGTPPPS